MRNIDLQEFRIERLKEFADKDEVELLVASSSANICYLTGGYYSISREVSPSAEIYIVLDIKTQEIFYVASVAEIPGILEHDPEASIVPYGIFQFPEFESSLYEKVERIACNRYETGIDALNSLIGHRHIKIAIDETAFRFMKYNYILQKKPNLKILEGNKIFQLARKIKHEEEVKGIRQSAQIAEKSLLRALDRFTGGNTELDLEQYYKEEVVKNGAIPFFFIASSDNRSAFVDVVNKSKKINEGSIVRFDFGCIYNHYCSDLARTAFVGEVDKQWEDKYKIIKNAQEMGLNMLKPGANVSKIFTEVVDYVRKNGIPNFHRGHCGHGIGLEGYDLPSISNSDESSIQENMCINIEVPYYELGRGGLQIENTTVINSNGFEILDSGQLDVIRL